MMGRRHHGQESEEGRSLDALKFNSDTALYFCWKILRPVVARYLKNGSPKALIAPDT